VNVRVDREIGHSKPVANRNEVGGSDGRCKRGKPSEVAVETRQKEEVTGTARGEKRSGKAGKLSKKKKGKRRID